MSLLVAVPALFAQARIELGDAYELSPLVDLYSCLYGVDIVVGEEYTADGKDRPITAVFEYCDGSGAPDACMIISHLRETLERLGIQQVHVNRCHFDDREEV